MSETTTIYIYIYGSDLLQYYESNHIERSGSNLSSDQQFSESQFKALRIFMGIYKEQYCGLGGGGEKGRGENVK